MFPSIWKTLKPCIGNCRIIAKSGSVLEKVSAQQHCSPPDLVSELLFLPSSSLNCKARRLPERNLPASKNFPFLRSVTIMQYWQRRCWPIARRWRSPVHSSPCSRFNFNRPPFHWKSEQIKNGLNLKWEEYWLSDHTSVTRCDGNNSMVGGRLGWWHKEQEKYKEQDKYKDQDEASVPVEPRGSWTWEQQILRPHWVRLWAG